MTASVAGIAGVADTTITVSMLLQQNLSCNNETWLRAELFKSRYKNKPMSPDNQHSYNLKASSIA